MCPQNKAKEGERLAHEDDTHGSAHFRAWREQREQRRASAPRESRLSVTPAKVISQSLEAASAGKDCLPLSLSPVVSPSHAVIERSVVASRLPGKALAGRT